MYRINLTTCSASDLFTYAREREPYTTRHELIFAAGALNNQKLRTELGCLEQARWDEGRRAADPEYENPYYRR